MKKRGIKDNLPRENSKRARFLLLKIVIAVLILTGVTLYFVFLNNPWKEGPGLEDESREDLPKIKECLSEENQNKDCNILFKDYETCLNLEELKDKCLYSTAVYTSDISLCWLIEDLELKDKCGGEVIVIGEIDE